jgi:hypothetical protein
MNSVLQFIRTKIKVNMASSSNNIYYEANVVSASNHIGLIDTAYSEVVIFWEVKGVYDES